MRSIRILALAAIFGSATMSGCASVPMAPKQANAEAKSFEAPADQAAIYVFRDETFGTAVTLPVWLDGRMSGALAIRTFFRWEVEPGTHQVASQGENYGQVKLDTDAGELYFVRLNARMGWAQPRVAIDKVSDSEGRDYVSQLDMATDQRTSASE